jgi:hypothetical protein
MESSFSFSISIREILFNLLNSEVFSFFGQMLHNGLGYDFVAEKSAGFFPP